MVKEVGTLKLNMPEIEYLRNAHVEALSPVHVAPYFPFPGQVLLVSTNGSLFGKILVND